MIEMLFGGPPRGGSFSKRFMDAVEAHLSGTRVENALRAFCRRYMELRGMEPPPLDDMLIGGPQKGCNGCFDYADLLSQVMDEYEVQTGQKPTLPEGGLRPKVAEEARKRYKAGERSDPRF